VDVRVLAASNADLANRAARGDFRLDLFYRLSAFPIELPTLAERRADIVPLAEHFLACMSAAMALPCPRLREEAVRMLESHPWRGNVRELQHVMERASILVEEGDTITAEHLYFSYPHNPWSPRNWIATTGSLEPSQLRTGRRWISERNLRLRRRSIGMHRANLACVHDFFAYAELLARAGFARWRSRLQRIHTLSPLSAIQAWRMSSFCCTPSVHFREAAGSLEQSYAKLRAEVERLRLELEETQSKLRREQALAEISSVLAHEIRNPLGSLELFAGLLAESDLNPDCHNWVEHVQAGLRTLAATVNNVLQFHSLPEPAARARRSRPVALVGARFLLAAGAAVARGLEPAKSRVRRLLFRRSAWPRASAAEPGAQLRSAPCPEAAGSNLRAGHFRTEGRSR
jgi:hypothetical protein